MKLNSILKLSTIVTSILVSSSSYAIPTLNKVELSKSRVFGYDSKTKKNFFGMLDHEGKVVKLNEYKISSYNGEITTCSDEWMLAYNPPSSSSSIQHLLRFDSDSGVIKADKQLSLTANQSVVRIACPQANGVSKAVISDQAGSQSLTYLADIDTVTAQVTMTSAGIPMNTSDAAFITGKVVLIAYDQAFGENLYTWPDGAASPIKLSNLGANSHMSSVEEDPKNPSSFTLLGFIDTSSTPYMNQKVIARFDSNFNLLLSKQLPLDTQDGLSAISVQGDKATVVAIKNSKPSFLVIDLISGNVVEKPDNSLRAQYIQFADIF